MSTKINKKKNPDLTLAESGMLWHLLRTRAANGTVQRHYSVIAGETGVSTSSAFRHIQVLIEKKKIEVVVPARENGLHGYPIPAVWRPIPPVESAHSANGTGDAQTGEKPIPNSEPKFKSGTGENRVNTGGSPFQNSQKPIPDGTDIHNSNKSTSSNNCVSELQGTCTPASVEKTNGLPAGVMKTRRV